MTAVPPRGSLAKAATFARFAVQQRRAAARIAGELGDAGPGLRINGSETGWTDSNFTAVAGQPFRVSATGAVWVSRALALGFEPRAALWVRIAGHHRIAKLVANDWVFDAWATGRVELMVKGLSEWADAGGALLPGKRPALGEGFAVAVTAAATPSVNPLPADWRYLWRLGDGQIYRETNGEIAVSTHGDVGILCRDVDVLLTPEMRLDWRWCIDALPSALPEDLVMTHDYLSIAVEFDNGQDLTYMWSAGLRPGHVFACPLDWWCDRETHWVLRSGPEGQGAWHAESRIIAADYAHAIGGPLPARVISVWLIANSVFQRRAGRARFADIIVA